MDFRLKFVSLKSAPIGMSWSGYYGGRFINKFGKMSFTLYCKDTEEGGDLCICLPLTADIKSKIPPNTGYLDLTYLGMGFSGKFHSHKFELKCTPIPQGNVSALKLMSALQKHTESLNDQTKLLEKKDSIFEGVIGGDPFAVFADHTAKANTVSAPKAVAKANDPFAIGV